jgi:hypothetical protein
MIVAGFDGVARQPQRHLRAIDGAEDFRKRNVEIAEPGVRGLLLLILLLGLPPQLRN